MGELAALRNLGQRSEAMLNAVGIASEDDLRKAGPAESYWRLKLHGFKASLNFLWAIDGALKGIDLRELPAERKAELLAELAALQ
jgi:DNA transformation protein and related proteins